MGIGGGIFMMYFDNKIKSLISFDGCEIVLSNVDEILFLDKYGKVVKWIEVVVGGCFVGVLGILDVFVLVYKCYGKLEW